MDGHVSGYESSCPRSTPSTVFLTPISGDGQTPVMPPPPPRPPLHPSISKIRSSVDFSSQQAQKIEGKQSLPSPLSRKVRKLTSPIWDHFEKLTINGEKTAKCVHCDKMLSANTTNGTSHLKDHLNLRCSKKNLQVDIHQKLLNISRKSDGTCSLDTTNFNHEVSRKELANMVIMHEYPLAIVNHIGFRRSVTTLNPSFKIISHTTLRADIMNTFTSEKAGLKKGLKKVLENSESKVAITTDMWTPSNQKRGYMVVVTAH